MATKKPTVPDQVNVITLKCAKAWHKAFKDRNNKGFKRGDLPASIVIPYANVEQIVTDFNKHVAKGLNGVRLYLIIKPKQQKGRPRISCILVPTTGPRYPNKEGIYKDLVVNATLKKGALKNPDCNTINKKSLAVALDEGDDGYASIYDFTRPCPPYCDPESPVNG